jgi:hypothetical protein
MKIKILEAHTPERIEMKFNEFQETNDVRYTQSHITKDGDEFVYTLIIFYVEPENNQVINKLIGRGK